VLILTGAAMVFTWFQLNTMVQSTILWIGWPILGAITAIQTFTMLLKLVQRQRGYKV
jgi:biofilm PGA synthesis N-glycosyltransferase PgaC